MNFGLFIDLVLGLDHFCFVVFYLLEIIVFDFFPSFFGLGRLCISGHDLAQKGFKLVYVNINGVHTLGEHIHIVDNVVLGILIQFTSGIFYGRIVFEDHVCEALGQQKLILRAEAAAVQHRVSLIEYVSCRIRKRKHFRLIFCRGVIRINHIVHFLHNAINVVRENREKTFVFNACITNKRGKLRFYLLGQGFGCHQPLHLFEELSI